MGVSLYIVFYNKLLRPNKCRFVSLFVFFFVYLFVGAYLHMLINQQVELQERKDLEIYLKKFYQQHRCLDQDETSQFIQDYLEAVDNGISFGVNTIYLVFSFFFLSFPSRVYNPIK